MVSPQPRKQKTGCAPRAEKAESSYTSPRSRPPPDGTAAHRDFSQTGKCIMKCPQCNSEVSGRFCGLCGSSLEERPCPACSAPLPPGHRFCGECGATASAGEATPLASGLTASTPGAPSKAVVWGVGSLVAAVVILILPSFWSSWPGGSPEARVPVSAAVGGSPGSALGGPQGVDLSSMTPREAADRLFNRVMAALSAGNQGEVQSFLPMAIDAYRLVPGLDHDGLFHLSLLQQAGEDFPAALASAQQVLENDPNHLLALYAAAEAARAQGNLASARGHYARIMEIYDAESARGLPEYTEHASFLPTIRETATDFLSDN